jgi:hypothetical protein
MDSSAVLLIFLAIWENVDVSEEYLGVLSAILYYNVSEVFITNVPS